MNPKFTALKLELPFKIAGLYTRDPIFKRPKMSAKIPISIPGGAGDTVLAIPVIRELKRLCGDVVVYTKYPDVYSFFMPDEVYDSSGFPGYDYWITLIGLVMFSFQNNFTGFKNKEVEKLYYNVRQRSGGEWEQIIRHHPYLDNALQDLAIKSGRNREDLPFYFMGLDSPPRFTFDIKSKPLPPELMHMEGERFITIHDGFENYTHRYIERSTKNWHIEHLENFVKMFKRDYPDVMVVQLGGEIGRDLSWVDYNFRDRLSFQESFQLLSRSLLHVDGDSGLVHAAHAMGVKSSVLWGPTKPEYYGHRENLNIKGDGCEGGCFWLKPDWMERCPLGYSRPLCMDSISPEYVLALISSKLLIKP